MERVRYSNNSEATPCDWERTQPCLKCSRTDIMVGSDCLTCLWCRQGQDKPWTHVTMQIHLTHDLIYHELLRQRENARKHGYPERL